MIIFLAFVQEGLSEFERFDQLDGFDQGVIELQRSKRGVSVTITGSVTWSSG